MARSPWPAAQRPPVVFFLFFIALAVLGGLHSDLVFKVAPASRHRHRRLIHRPIDGAPRAQLEICVTRTHPISMLETSRIREVCAFKLRDAEHQKTVDAFTAYNSAYPPDARYNTSRSPDAARARASNVEEKERSDMHVLWEPRRAHG
jgi:hypothetical protein